MRLLPVLLVTGCAGGYQLTRPDPPPMDPLLAPPPALGQVCVLRPLPEGPERLLLVRDNGALVGATSALTHFCYFAQPGPHRVVATFDGPDPRPVETALLALAGQRYFLRQELIPSGHKLVIVDETEARAVIGRTTFHVLARVPGGAKPDPAPMAWTE